jgi:uncharacterized repeat protein (TIGR01451 family)
MKTRNLFALFLFCALIPGIAGAQEMKTLHGHVPAAISRHHLKPAGQVAPETSLNLAIGLPLRNTEALSNLLEQIYDPTSPNYHHYLTPEQFTAQFGPSEEDYQMVVNFAKVNNLSVTGTHPNRMLLDVRGKASDIEKAFQVTLRTYHHPTENRDFYAPDVDPSVNSALPILHVSGLENYSLPRPNYRMRPVSGTQSAPATEPTGAMNEPSSQGHAAGTAPGQSYWGSDFRNAYVPGSSLTGTGQSVALLQFDGFFASDIASYAAQTGITNPPQIVVVPIDGGVPSPDPADGEPPLDIEMVMSMAPGVSTIYVYEEPNNGDPWEDMLNRMASDDLAKQVSSSWFEFDGPPDPVAEQIFQEMDLQGQSFFQAAGDDDAYTGLIPFPCDSPYLTVVGGTTLSTGNGSRYASETVWNWGIEFGIDGIGSGGGISTTYPLPIWQTNINFALCQGSSVRRNIPDVALTADNVYVIFGGGQTGIFGGTSCAAPLWAGFTSLVNEQGTNNGLAPVGFLNPTLYALANKAIYTNCFHDITTGNNTWSGSPNLFFAVTNYDLCTGLGTPNGTNLINALATASTTNVFTHISPPLPPYGTVMANLNGGNPNGNWYLFIQDAQAQNAGMISNGWSITLTTANPVGYVADDYLSMSATPTNLPAGFDTTITVGVNNYGPSTSSNIVVSDTFPNGFTLVSSSTATGTVVPDINSIFWDVGNLTNTASAQVTLTLQAPSGAEQNAVNFASVSADTPDQNPADATASAIFNVVQAPQSPGLSSLGFANGKFLLTVSGNSAYPVVIQASTNLISWVSISTNTPPVTFTDTVSSPFPYRFYRALVQ